MCSALKTIQVFVQCTRLAGDIAFRVSTTNASDELILLGSIFTRRRSRQDALVLILSRPDCLRTYQSNTKSLKAPSEGNKYINS